MIRKEKVTLVYCGQQEKKTDLHCHFKQIFQEKKQN
jgi:hypothetical protein